MPLSKQTVHLVARMMQAEVDRYQNSTRIELGPNWVVYCLKWESEALCYCFPVLVEVAVEVVHHFHLDH